MSLHDTHPNLVHYVEAKNAWDKAMRQAGRPSTPKLYDLRNMTVADLTRLRGEIECDLSPENLTCDGELSGDNLQRKAAHLNRVKAELENFCGK